MRKPILLIAFTAIFCLAAVFVWKRMNPPSPGGEITRHFPTDAGNSDSPPRLGEIFVAQGTLANAGLDIATVFTGPIRDPTSLKDLRDAIQARGPRGLEALDAELKRLQRSPVRETLNEVQLQYRIGTLLMYEGRFDEAAAMIERTLSLGRSAGLPVEYQRVLTAVLGIIALRRGEIDNCIMCVGPSSCIFPIAPDAIHQNQDGSREAIKHFTAYLEELPGDIRVRWLLNLAYMTLGEYPDKVPPQHLIPLDPFQSKIDVGRFENVAPMVGLTSRGPNLAGGSVFDDFTGDGLPDLFTTSLDADRGASLYVNRGDGTFDDRSESAGLSDQVYALNVTHGDFDNDGNLDVLLLRGGWEKPMRLSLLHNEGNGVFADVTVTSGVAQPIATESAVWGDYDNDGLVDLFVCGEYLPISGRPTKPPDPRNRCRLYHNLGNGKFVDVAAAAGIVDEVCSKGSAWGDYDADGRLDLYVSNINGPSHLYHNEGGGKFRDVARKLGVTGPNQGFACWFWDYDNDGLLDIYVNDYTSYLSDVLAYATAVPDQQWSGPRLYRNLGAAGFRDVAREVGLDRPMMPMGCNFADIDNDGFLDIHLGTGRMSLEQLSPNLMFKNVAGRHFEDVTVSSGTGHLQKGHGVSFADWDCNGNLDLFVEIGGAVPGDKGFNVLFQNPGHDHHWLKVKLIGTNTNAAALGAKIRAVVKGPDGTTRSIYRTIGNNSSFGGNSLVELIGLLDATSVAELELSWPSSGTTQVFRDVPADQMIEITEGTDSFNPVAQSPLQIPRRDAPRTTVNSNVGEDRGGQQP